MVIPTKRQIYTSIKAIDIKITGLEPESAYTHGSYVLDISESSSSTCDPKKICKLLLEPFDDDESFSSLLSSLKVEIT